MQISSKLCKQHLLITAVVFSTISLLPPFTTHNSSHLWMVWVIHLLTHILAFSVSPWLKKATRSQSGTKQQGVKVEQTFVLISDI